MCEVLTKSGLSFMVKIIREIVSMPRADSGYPHNFHHNFMVNSWVFKDDEFKSDAKTNSRHLVCLILFRSPLLARRVHAQSPLLAYCVNACTHTHAHTPSHSPARTRTHNITHIFLTFFQIFPIYPSNNPKISLTLVIFFFF